MALDLFFGIYVYSLSLANIRYTRLFYSIQAKHYFYFIHNKLRMRSHTIYNPMGEKALITFMHFADLIIGGGLLYTFLANIGDWQAGISLGILIMFAILRGASLLEDINNKREQRRAKKIENDHIEWENGEKRKPKEIKDK
jgi:hypothetical protein